MRALPIANHLTEAELEERIHQQKEARMRDKYRALLWIKRGEPRQEVARRLGVSAMTLVNWVKRYQAEGERGLGHKAGQGRKRVLTEERVEQVKGWVRETEGVWTLRKMQAKLREEEGLRVSLGTIWYRLRRGRWSWKTGRPRHWQADAVQQEAFKKKGWRRR